MVKIRVRRGKSFGLLEWEVGIDARGEKYLRSDTGGEQGVKSAGPMRTIHVM